jgi:hypothetical protein
MSLKKTRKVGRALPLRKTTHHRYSIQTAPFFLSTSTGQQMISPRNPLYGYLYERHVFFGLEQLTRLIVILTHELTNPRWRRDNLHILLSHVIVFALSS